MDDAVERTSRGLGWTLFIAGSVVLTGYALYAFATDTHTDLGIRLSVAALLLGIFGLFISVLRQRLAARKSDKYRDVEI